MTIEYQFIFDQESDKEYHYVVEQNGDLGKGFKKTANAQWTLLNNSKCSNCPLNDEERCPAAVSIEQIVDDFRSLPGYKKATIRVKTRERTVEKYTGLEEGVRSLMGLVMANSGCPILSKLKPMATTHLPFSSQNEFIIRSVGTYLLRQYYRFHDGKEVDWELDGLIQLNQQLQLVNQAMWQRIHDACEGDSNLKALLSFFALSSSVSYSLESQLQKLKPNFMEQSDFTNFK